MAISSVQVKKIIAISSGKGGVGKSAVAVNIALSLLKKGYRVGLLDADIYGPSQGMMLGIDDNIRLEVINIDTINYYVPIVRYGLQIMSMAFLMSGNTPVIWRGPMASKMLQQMLLQTNWQELDILLVDMPPGTGDIQLTLTKSIKLFGSIIVTTPQCVSLLDVRRSIEMFQKVQVPCLGVIENMSWHICGQCGHKEHIFGSQGMQNLCDEYKLKFLGSLPLERQVSEDLDSGKLPVLVRPESQWSIFCLQITNTLLECLDKNIPLYNID